MNHSPTAPLASSDYKYEREHDGPAPKEHVSDEELKSRRKRIRLVGLGNNEKLYYLVRCAKRGLVAVNLAEDLEHLVTILVDAGNRTEITEDDCFRAIPRELARDVCAIARPDAAAIDGDKRYFRIPTYKSCLC